ncbi:hypothetical protein RCO48_35595 [Peribacillus frigoritolerans]|nr:hypothetical protein [Peribacillus frigoritolerans]
MNDKFAVDISRTVMEGIFEENNIIQVDDPMFGTEDFFGFFRNRSLFHAISRRP